MIQTRPSARFAILSVAMVALLTAIFFAALSLIASVAHAQGITPPPLPEPSPQTSELLALLLSGKHLAFVGAAMVLGISAARAGIGAIVPWFKSQAGGYVLSYGSAFGLYVGAALQAGSPVDFSLLATATAVAWAASGGWEAFRDLLNFLLGKSPAAAKLTTMLAIGMVLSMSAGCASTGPVVRERATIGAAAFLECQDPNVQALVADLVPFARETILRWIAGDGTADGTGIKQSAAKIGTMVGQCAWEAAMRVLTEPAPQFTGAAAAPVRINAADLAAKWASARAELAWSPVQQ